MLWSWRSSREQMCGRIVNVLYVGFRESDPISTAHGAHMILNDIFPDDIVRRKSTQSHPSIGTPAHVYFTMPSLRRLSATMEEHKHDERYPIAKPVGSE